jgi:hypothetical protein
VIGFLVAGMAIYMALSQPDRFWAAYSGPLGIVAAPLLIAALVAPFAAGILLARVEDVDY